MSVRIGVDVGGTFTKAVALDTDTLALLAEAIVPTTHDHPDGTAAGVVDVVRRLADSVGAHRVELVTHSTTQAVNALLEGDVAVVGMIGMGRSPDLRKARRRTIVPRIELSADRSLATLTEFVDVTRGLDDATAEAVIARLQAAGAEIICLAGYMRLFTPLLIGAFAGRLLNIHPSLLPSFPGLHPHEQALAAGVKLHGCTVHLVNEVTDGGPILAQAAVPVLPGDTAETLGARVLMQEHLLYPQALARFAQEGM